MDEMMAKKPGKGMPPWMVSEEGEAPFPPKKKPAPKKKADKKDDKKKKPVKKSPPKKGKGKK